MSYDFSSNIFHATADVFVNTPGGFITGTGQNGRAGWSVFHFAANEWYIHIGTPSDMIGLKMGIAGISVRTGNYFMAGTNIPASPSPPAKIAEILGTSLDDLDYMKNLNSLGNGSGFAFGTHFSFETGDMTVLILYARFSAGVGSDIMLKKYGNVSCGNRNGEPIGFNGWYANGQAYAYLAGELGVKVKVFGYKKQLPIIETGTAALFQIKAPNPFWMRGTLAGNYYLLGGLVKGRYKFDMQFGEECDIIAGEEGLLGGIKIIADVSPAENENDVNVFAIPQASFNMNVNEAVEIEENDGIHTYKIILDKFTVVDEAGKEISGSIEYKDGGSVANFMSNEILPPVKKLKTVVEVSFMERKNGMYQTLMLDGIKATERIERSFTTGDAPAYIPLENVQYTYPVVEQENFYTAESNQGYIRLKRGQSYLFEDSNWTTLGKFTDNEGNSLPANFSYSAADNEVRFDIPNLQNTKDYTFLVVAKNKNESQNAAPQTVSETNNYGGEDGTSFETESRRAQSLTKDGEIERISFTFRTSRFNTLAGKIKSFDFNTVERYICTGLSYLQNGISSDEYFDKTELLGSAYTANAPLITVSASMDDAFAAKFKNLFYNDYPVEGIVLGRAGNAENNAGIPPVKALPIAGNYLIYLDGQNWNLYLKNTFPFDYDLFRYYRQDWYEIMSKASNLYVKGNRSGKITELVNSSFGVIPAGNYTVNVKYVMPGNKAGTQETVIYNFTK
jgi:hypothetical protein